MSMTALTNAVLLAAGLSRRMGQPKQLLTLGAQPLCRYAAYTMAQAGYAGLWAIVPTGGLGDEIAAALVGLPFHFIRHPDPALGLASSFRLAAQALPNQNAAFVLADMPLVTPATHQALLDAAQAAPIVLTRYGKTQAPPSLFTAPLLPALRLLPDHDNGPRELLRQYAAQVRYVQRPAAELLDIDTPQDLVKIQGSLQ